MVARWTRPFLKAQNLQTNRLQGVFFGRRESKIGSSSHMTQLAILATADFNVILAH